MATGKKESGGGVIELGVQPVIRTVAGFAQCGELRGDVIGIGGLSKVGLVARVARSRHGLETAVGAILMAGIAVHGCVSTRQREAIVVILNIFIRDLPSPDGVTLFAICAQLATVNVSMAILAALAYVGENHLHVTLSTGDRGVHAAKRIASLIVIEFRNSADRLPCARSVTVLTRYGQTPVRTVRAAGSLRSRSFCKQEKRKNQQEHEFRFYPSAHELPLAFALLPT